MKKLILTLIIALAAIGANAQIEVMKGTFRQIGIDAIAAGETLGSQNMTDMLTKDWPGDTDGNGPAALLRVKFTNLPDADVDKIRMALSGGKAVVETKTVMVDGKPERWFFTDPGRNLDLTFSHAGSLGTCVFSGATLEARKSYEITINNRALINVNFVTRPEGAKLYIDGEFAGNTPKQQELTMGQHNIGLINGNIQENFTVMIDPATTLIERDLRPKRDVKIRSQINGADIYINGTRYGKTPLTTTLAYDTYQIRIADEDGRENTKAVIVDETTTDINIEIFRTKTINFTPMYANAQASGVQLQITASDGSSAVGSNFNDYITVPRESATLPYGKYHLTAKYNIPDGRGLTSTKDFDLDVNDNTNSNQTIDLPTKRQSHNPFRIEYSHRSTGLSVRYVQKWFSYSNGSKHYKMNLGGIEGSMNGVQVGIPIQPYFGSGFGLGTGLYFEYYKTNVDYAKVDDSSTTHLENNSLEDMELYMPIHLQFRLPAARETSFFLSAGVGLTYGVALKAQSEDDGWENVKFGENGMPKAFNCAIEIGAGFRYRRLLIDLTYSIGMTKNELAPAINGISESRIDAKMNKLAAGIGLLF